MRRFEQKQLLELMNTIKDANGVLENLFLAGNIEEFQAILASQQTAAVSIGTKLEECAQNADANVVEQVTKTVHVLEEYCELLWHTNNSQDINMLKENVNKLDRYTEKIEKAIREVPVRLEVVFLPYKASMWDCMETVWKAANEDSECDVYVVPIPYFDIKKDRTVGDMHCEADLMPKYVPVTDYRSYNLEEHRPDIVYIHNPFDNCNLVTSVHPEYYSENLKKYTDMLVYIPYFLLGEHLADSQKSLPAYYNVDKIILTGEAMVEDLAPSVPREKLLPLGSPKAERLIWMKNHKDELDIPREWKRKIRNKKVIFYNVSLSGILQEKSKMLDKMEEVFSIFENRMDMILLYRPHPLMESTLTRMHPGLQTRYQKLVNFVKDMPNAIYDTTGDVGVSVAISDAYIGESTSSVVDMFKILKKPLFFLRTEKYYQPNLDEMLSDKTFDICRIGSDLWFITQKTQLLCKYNMQTEAMECIAEIPDKAKLADYTKLVNYENKLILIPQVADGIYVYNIDADTFCKDYFKNKNVFAKFGAGAVVYEHYVFLIPTQYPAIVRYDMLTGEFVYYEECVREAYKLMNHEEYQHPFTTYSIWQEEIYILSGISNIVLCFNMKTGEYKICAIGQETNRYVFIAADETYCWITKYQDYKVIRWNRKTDEVIEMGTLSEGYEYRDFPFNLCMTDNMLYLISRQSNRSLQMNKTTSELSISEFAMPYKEDSLVSEFFEYGDGINHTFAKMISENEIAACACYDNSLVIFDIDKKTCKKTPIRIPDQLKAEATKSTAKLSEMRECASMPLSKYLEYISQDLLEANIPIGWPKKKLETDNPVGKKIHEQIKAIINM